jgi:hypothetical protein
LKIEKDGIDSLSIEHKEKIQKSNDLLISSVLSNNNNVLSFVVFGGGPCILMMIG